MVVTLGQQYNFGEKPTVILYNYINCHAVVYRPPGVAVCEKVRAMSCALLMKIKLFPVTLQHLCTVTRFLIFFKIKIRTRLDFLSIPQSGGKMSKRLGGIKAANNTKPLHGI